MDVQLYVYDLSQGLARQFSRGFLGIQIDAVYHTSIVFGGVEYFFGQGVQTCYPGTTHHGRPMQVVSLGKTHLDLDVILEYLESLKQIYTAESYDLFAHNCNNFANDFAMFLVGRGIPEHITSLPQTVLNTPFGQMLRPQIDAAMREVTQAPVPVQNVPHTTRAQTASATTNGAPQSTPSTQKGKVQNVTTVREIDQLLDSAKSSVAVIFCASSANTDSALDSCFRELAEEADPKDVFIKVDLDKVSDFGATYKDFFQAAPALMTIKDGIKHEQWPCELGSVSDHASHIKRLLLRAHSQHPHNSLRLSFALTDEPDHSRNSTFDFPVLVSGGREPPGLRLSEENLSADTCQHPAVSSIRDFIRTISTDGANEAPLPNLPALATFLRNATEQRSSEEYDLLRLLKVALADERVAAFFAAEEDPPGATLTQILARNINRDPSPSDMHIRELLSLATPLLRAKLAWTYLLPSSPDFAKALVSLLTHSLLNNPKLEPADGSPTHPLQALTGAVYVSRLEQGKEILPEEQQVELLAAILEALGDVETYFALLHLVRCLTWLVYGAPVDGEVLDLCRAMDVKSIIQEKRWLLDGNPEVLDGNRYHGKDHARSFVDEAVDELFTKGLEG